MKQGSVLSEQTELLVLLSFCPRIGIKKSHSRLEQAGECNWSRALHHTLSWHRNSSLQRLISSLLFFTPLLGELFSVVQTSTSHEAAQLYLHHFLNGKTKSERETDLTKQNASLGISVKGETDVQESLPPCILLSPRDYLPSVLCRDAGGSLLCS